MQPSFDPSTLRDPGFRARFEAKWAEVEAVQQAGRFVDYATRQGLFSELEAIYAANLAAYESQYAQPKAELATLVARLENHGPELLTSDRVAIAGLLQQANAHLTAADYATNGQALPLLEAAQQQLEAALAGYRQLEEELAAWREALKMLMTEIWADDYPPFKAAYQAAKGQLQAGERPEGPLAPDSAAAQAARQRREADLDSLSGLLRQNAPGRAAVAGLEGRFVPRQAFLDLRRRLRRQRALRVVAWGVGGLAGAILLSWLGWQAPQWWQHSREGEAWAAVQADPSVTAYQRFLQRYPQGSYAAQADSLLRQLPEGRLKGWEGMDGRRLDYEGELKKLLPEGEGRAIYADGGVYEGQWQQGQPHGKGTYLSPDSARYTGSWYRGLREGQGTQVYHDRAVYAGAWRADQRHGYGRWEDTDGTFYRGEWQRGQPGGKGLMVRADGQRYQGGWQQGEFHGQGEMTTADSLRYAGSFVKGKREGQGIQRWPDGRRYEGAWKADLRQGEGKLSWPSGGYFEGYWQADTLNGAGRFVSRFRDEYQGIWRGRPERVVLYNGQGDVFKAGYWQDGMFIGLGQ
jgi:exonuclease VII small subunit